MQKVLLGENLVDGKGLVNWWLEAAHVFHRCALSIAGLQILVQNSNYFIIQNLELANSLNHFLQRLQTSKKQTQELALDMKSLSQKSNKCCYLTSPSNVTNVSLALLSQWKSKVHLVFDSAALGTKNLNLQQPCHYQNEHI